AAMLAGDFTAFTSPACNAGRQISLRAPFVNNRVDPSVFSPVAMRLAAKLPKTDDPCGQITFGRRNIDDQGQLIAKVDYQYNTKNSLFGRFLYSADSTPSPFKFTPDNFLNASQEGEARSYAFTAGSTYLVSPSTVNAFRISVTRNRQITLPDAYFDLTELG